MSNAKEIRGQIKSIKNTQQITKAMETVAASKMRRARENMESGKPYADNILRVIGHLSQASNETTHPFFVKREQVKKVGYIVISSDRGLCGGLNINVFKKLLADFKVKKSQDKEIVASVFGRKGTMFLNRVGTTILSADEDYGDNPSLDELIGGIHTMIDAFKLGDVDEVHLVGNRFVNSMTQEPYIMQLLPATLVKNDHAVPDYTWDFVYEPSAYEILEHLAIRYVESLVRQAVAENIACEMSARMIAMKNATDNAGDLIGELQLKYNKARQAAITQELSEIVAGADAV
ncbi:F0F1 ATP synthase subunit gamma [Rappaport israeli]|uniref:F0F1 ATP synthase subunit gamma n=1 Tax=Rappaport israeli TaxID=1839807 RepID=UPI0009307BEE|nr:F0F1 ATP synthase subunit gamma [Rappaport israeli]